MAIKKKDSSKKSAVVDNKIIDNAVAFINESANKSIYKGYLEIGNYLLETFFDNDPDNASSKNPYKNTSYKELIKREDLAVGFTTLTMTVRVAAQEKFFEANETDTKKLTYTHKAELIKLPNDKAKLTLVKKCISKNLSTRMLQEEIKSKREQLPRAEVPVSKDLRNRFKRLDTLIEKNKELPDASRLGDMKGETIQSIKESCEETVEKLKELSGEYEQLLEDLDAALNKS